MALCVNKFLTVNDAVKIQEPVISRCIIELLSHGSSWASKTDNPTQNLTLTALINF